MIQYSNGYSSCPTQIQNIVANDVSLLDMYVLMQTGDNEWTAQIITLGTGKTREMKFTRGNTSGFNNIYTVTRKDNVEFNATYNNEYYLYSNMGFGQSLDLPVYQGVTSWSLMIISCILMFAVVFKGSLFKCLKRRRK